MRHSIQDEVRLVQRRGCIGSIFAAGKSRLSWPPECSLTPTHEGH